MLVLPAALLLALIFIEGRVYASDRTLREAEPNQLTYHLAENSEIQSKPESDVELHTQPDDRFETIKDLIENDQPTLYISGTVRDLNNQPLPGVTLSDGAGGNTTSGSNGDYEFSDLAAGTYTITPNFGGASFSPSFRNVSVPPKANKQDFIQVNPSVYLPLVTRRACVPFFDDFSDPGSGWPTFEDQISAAGYTNGEYKILVKDAQSWEGVSPDFQTSEYTAGVDVSRINGIEGSHGIIFGIADNWSSFHTFEIDTAGYYTVWEFSETGGWKNLMVAFSPDINQGAESNKLEVKNDGISIEFYANGNLLTSPKSKINSGKGYLGLIVSTFEDGNVEARFDNFFVDPLVCD